ncbi:MAG: hypothetical protein WDW36_002503 [Sanguina aurantia]
MHAKVPFFPARSHSTDNRFVEQPKVRRNLPADFLATADDVRVQVSCPTSASGHGQGSEACAAKMLFMRSKVVRQCSLYLHSRMTPASAGSLKETQRSNTSKQSSEGQELEGAHPVLVLILEVEDEQHVSIVVALLESFYTGCLPQGFPAALLLPAMQASEFPTLAVLGMPYTLHMLEAYSDILGTAHNHLSEEFFHGDATQIMQASTSCYERFLALPYEAVLALMDGRCTAKFAGMAQTQLFSNWCCSPAGRLAVEQLCSLSTSTPTDDTTKAFPFHALFHLPPALQSLPAFSPVMDAAHTQLAATFGDAAAIVHSTSLRESFRWLPFSAVLGLLRSDQLLTDTEATVLLLLDHWLRTGSCSDEGHTELASAIRYSRLPSAYLVELGARLRCGLSHEAQVEVGHYRLSGTHTVRDHSRDWFKPARGASPGSPGSGVGSRVRLSLTLTPGGVAGLLRSKAGVGSACAYYGGFLWGLRARADGDSVWLSVDVAGVSSMDSPHECVEFSSGVVCDHQLWLGEDSPHMVSEGAGSHVIGGLSYELQLKSDGILAPASLFWLEELATKGHVTVLASISNIHP